MPAPLIITLFSGIVLKGNVEYIEDSCKSDANWQSIVSQWMIENEYQE